MDQRVQMDLPDLNDYRQDFVSQGIDIPLPTVPFSETGLLAALPPPPPGKQGWPWTVETPPLSATLPNETSYPKISIMTPSYNQGQFIEETIRSVLLQNYPNLEYVIMDGGSTDGTKEILEKYSPWLSFWQSKQDRGQGHAINLGFSLASGEYLGWINSDDFYLPECFQRVSTQSHIASPGFIYGDAISLFEHGQKLEYWQANLVLDRYLRFGGLIASHTAFWKKSLHQPIWEKMNCNVDGELWIRLVPETVKSHIKFPLGVCRIQPQAKTHNKRYIPLWKEDDMNIAHAYGQPPKLHSFISYEYRLAQSLYKRLNKKMSRENIRMIAHQCSWLERSIALGC